MRDLDRLERSGALQDESIAFTPGTEDHWESFPRENPFLNRERELRMLEEFTTRDEKADHHGLLLHGPSGIGKSRLLGEMHDRLLSGDGVVWFHACRRETTDRPYHTLGALMQNFTHFLKSLPVKRQYEVLTYFQKQFADSFALLVELIPELERWLEEESETGTGRGAWKPEDYHKLFARFCEIIARYGKGLVICIDDLQHMEETSAQVVLGLSQVGSARISVIATIEEDSENTSAALLSRVGPEVAFEHVYVEALGESVVASLLQELFSSKLGASTELLEPLYAASGGNPGAIRAILQHLIDRGLVFYEQNAWHTRLREALALIRERAASGPDLLALLPPEDIETLRFAAVFQRAFTVEALSFVSGQEVTQLLPLLDRALRETVLNVDNERLYSFRDHSLRRQLRDSLPAEIRVEAHRRVATYLENNVLPESPAARYDIGHHLEQAMEFEAACRMYVLAAQLTDNGTFSNRQSMIYYDLARRMLDLGGTGMPVDEQFEVRFQALQHTHTINPGQADLHKQLESLEALVGDDTLRRIRTLASRASLSFYSGDRAEMQRCSEEILALAKSPDHDEHIVGTLVFLGSVPSDKTYEERVDLLSRGMSIALRLGRSDLIGASVAVYANLLAYLCRFREADRAIERIAARFANAAQSTRAGPLILFPRGILMSERGNFEDVLRGFDAGVDIAELNVGTVGLRFLTAHRARALGIAGKTREALELYDQLLADDGDPATKGERTVALHGRVLMALKEDDPQSALEYLEAAHAHLKLRPDAYMSATFYILGVHAYLRQGQSTLAEKDLEAASEIAHRLKAPLLDFHLGFAKRKLEWSRRRDPAVLKETEELLGQMLAADITGYYELYRQDFKSWQQTGSDSSSTTFIGATGANRELLQLIEINRKISSTLDLNALLSEVLEGAMQIAGAQHGYLFTCETAEAEGRPVTPIPELVLTRQAGGGAVPEGEQLYSRTVLHTVIDSRSAIVSRDARRERQWSASESVSEHRLRSLLCVPILLHADILGVLYLDNNEASGVFTLHDREIVENFAVQVAIAMNNARVFAREQQARRQTEATLRTFERFIPRQFTERFAEGNIELLETGLSREESLSVLFSDIRQFTSFAETRTPAETFLFLNDYLDRMERPIRAHQGFVDKFIGDAIMAIFDAEPVEAVRAGLDMLAELEELNRWRRERNLSQIECGIGVNTGPAMIGVVGSRDRMDTTVMGDSVNTASRIESLTKLYGTPLLIGEDTYERVRENHDLAMRLLDRVQVKGRARGVGIYEVFSADPAGLRDRKAYFRERFEQAYQAYESGAWQEAEQLFAGYAADFPEDRCVLPLLERVKLFQTVPPADWSGVYRMETK